MQAFAYVRPNTLAEALAVLAREGEGARCLGGGTDLIVQLRERRRSANTVVDVKRVPELNVLAFDPQQGLIIGAAVPCYRIYSDADVAANYPGLVDAVKLIGGVAIQGRATLGGNVCTASPAGDSIPALIVHRAVVAIASLEGTREVALEDFFVGPGKTILKPHELVVHFKLPPPPAGFGAAYLRFTPRNEMDIAVVGVGAALTVREGRIVDARIALGAVAPTPLLAREAAAVLIGSAPTEEAFEAAARAAQAVARPITDVRGTAEQRRHLVGVLTRRALRHALARAMHVA
ncbi:MAG: xanthine dehydrogenase family protein subunit M [Thermoflexales bacterium]|nr:xanthine dehydrogenase family protein subunit M [Thermoflexales bacterium]MCS7325657.1 xanthine dehydrogenase family protein subunit M [Thermoflexales bacterium]MCX7939719.1 xanthine dehydrogenase family protein subunit M [Thermoflexales bacterium]MDW8292567.1 xanthine dehydrogenase family protein subunit M [Anaerolineae bacterium]